MAHQHQSNKVLPVELRFSHLELQHFMATRWLKRSWRKCGLQLMLKPILEMTWRGRLSTAWMMTMRQRYRKMTSFKVRILFEVTFTKDVELFTWSGQVMHICRTVVKICDSIGISFHDLQSFKNPFFIIGVLGVSTVICLKIIKLWLKWQWIFKYLILNR